MWVGKEFRIKFFSWLDGGGMLVGLGVYDLVCEDVIFGCVLMVELGGNDWKVDVKFVL